MQAEISNLVGDDLLPVLPVNSPEFWEDPEPFVAIARRQHPWLARFTDGYIVHGFRANQDLMADDEHLHMGLDGLVDFYGLQGSEWGRFMNEMLNSQRGANHARIRKSVALAFTPRNANHVRPLVQRVIGELLDQWAPKGAIDFTEFAADFPIGVLCAILGVSTSEIPRLRIALEAQPASLTFDHALAPVFLAGFESVWSFVDTVVREREASGIVNDDALLDAMIAAKTRGDLDERELRYLIMVLLFGGYDTSKNMLALTVNLLIDRPDMYARCAEDLDFCTRVINEALRHSGIASVVRQVKSSFEYDGFRFPEGALVALSTTLAGRDPAVFDEPMVFDPERKATHIAFGRGPHMCIGQFLARVQLEEGLHMIAKRMPNIRRTGEIAWRPLLGAWGLRTMPVAFDVV